MSEDQLQPEDTLDDRGVDDVLDEGISPPEAYRGVTAKGTTTAEQIEGETIDDRLPQEEPDVWEAAEVEDENQAAQESGVVDGPVGGEVGSERTGRLGEDVDDLSSMTAEDEGIDGAAAGAEEAAMHTIEDDPA
ncbi:DUF5709 domain-containing protein [uncultured Nocardioides sp.]|uniref:DUF5709 domain-containing protein n=1 Tax=uncultured Nocardioides sp. TaxID=198441 RepID=UPI002624D7D1|nr:DUF5709 domain-containing protein [uncultured Nocardioides sp.]